MINRMTLKNTSGEQPERHAVPSQISLIELVGILIRKRFLLAVVTAAAMLIMGLVIFLSPNRYLSRASLLPSGKPNQLSSLKELTGLGDFAFSSDENSSELFPVILKSGLIKDALAQRTYRFQDGSEEKELTLQDYFSEKNHDRLSKAIDKTISVSVDHKTGVISLGAETKYPGFSQTLLREAIATLENFNLNKRQSQAKNRERYLARELTAREADLAAAESKLEEFQSVNRDWDNSSDPEILRTLIQMRREIEIKSKTCLFLHEQYEIAQLDVQKDLPIVITLDEPSLPTVKSWPPRMIFIFLSGVMAFVLTYLILILWDSIRNGARSRPNTELEMLRSDFVDAFPVINRLVTRRKSTEILQP